MNDLRPKPEQPKEQPSPNVVREPNTPAIPPKQNVTSPQPKGPDSGGNRPHDAGSKDSERVSTQSKR